MLITNKVFPLNIQALVFDWGDTLMHDFKDKDGPMYLWDSIKVIDGIEDILKKASASYKLFVGSNSGYSDKKMMIKALERGRIAGYFTEFFASKDMMYEKPDPRFFEFIVKETGIPASQIAMCGNDYIKDIEAAKKAGLFTLYFNADSCKQKDMSCADIIFNRFEKLNSIL